MAEVIDLTENIRNEGQANGKRSVLVIIYKQPNANIIATVDEINGAAARATGLDAERRRAGGGEGSHDDDPRGPQGSRAIAGHRRRAGGAGDLRLRSARAGFIAAVTVPVSLAAARLAVRTCWLEA